MKPRDMVASLITVLAALRCCTETYVDTEGNEAYVAEVYQAIDPAVVYSAKGPFCEPA